MQSFKKDSLLFLYSVVYPKMLLISESSFEQVTDSSYKSPTNHCKILLLIFWGRMQLILLKSILGEYIMSFSEGLLHYYLHIHFIRCYENIEKSIENLLFSQPLVHQPLHTAL